MKKSLVVLVGAGILLGVFASRFAVSAKSSDEAEILRIETQTALGEQQNDVSVMHLFAEDYIAAGVKVLTKKQFEENVKRNFATHENGINPYTIEKKDMNRSSCPFCRSINTLLRPRRPSAARKLRIAAQAPW